MNEPLDYNLLFEIKDFPEYFVGTDLNIYSEKWGKLKKLNKCINSNGYYIVGLWKEGKDYKKRVHRLIAKMFIKNPDDLPQVDHINHNKTDNRIENLRWVSGRDNDRNRSMNKNNTSGHQGVYFDEKQNSWVARWYDDEKKRIRKSFSINKYGDTQAKQLAIDYRKKMVDKLYNRPEPF